MSDSDSTSAAGVGKPAKPSKPYPEFPLFPHATRRWAKKIRGQLHYFGPWDDPQGSLDKYLQQKDALHAGRKPREAAPESVTVKDVANAFLNSKQALLDAGELSPRTFISYRQAADVMVGHLGKGRLVSDLRPEDFAGLRAKMAKRWGPYRLGVTIQYIRSAFKHAFDADLIPTPVRFGPAFKGPTRKTVRLHRARQGAKLFTAEELRRMLDAAGVPVKAMLLLGVNCGFGNSDCGRLPLSAVDLDRGWIDYPRPKTGIARRCPLWPETVEALREALASRPKPKAEEHAGLAFVTKYGGPWAKDTPDSTLSKEMRKLMDRLGIEGHRNFYTLRHTFRTVGDEAKDQPAIDFLMGHARDDMASAYRERISDERLRAVSDYVRAWLLAAPKASGEAGSRGH